MTTFRPSLPRPGFESQQIMESSNNHQQQYDPLSQRNFMQQEEPIYVRTHNNRVSKNEEISLNSINNGGSRNGSSINGEVRFNNMYGDHSLNRPPPPMYRRVPPPAHMMTLDRRIPGGAGQGVRGLQHQLLPSGCDVTLNRRHFNNADLRNTNHCSPMQRRLPDDLWLV